MLACTKLDTAARENAILNVEDMKVLLPAQSSVTSTGLYSEVSQLGTAAT